MADLSLDELKRRLLAGQAKPEAHDPSSDVFVDRQGQIRTGTTAGSTEPLSKVPKKVFATEATTGAHSESPRSME